MIRLVLMVWLCMPALAAAQTVAVTSGDHDGFTRLVLDFGAPVDWQVGRTDDGYELRLNGARPVYDLSGVYDLIGRNRLAAVWANPDTGGLRLGIGCACHAMPFEFRPGIVVVDLKDGPPPKASSFERGLDGGLAPRLTARATPRPRPRPLQTGGYDWTVAALAPPVAPETPPTAMLPPTDPNMQPLRDVLVQQLSRGATQGVIDMAIPAAPNPTATATPSVRTGLGELPGIVIDGDAGSLTAQGGACVADARLDIASWAADAPISTQMADTASLIGEFDAPNPDAVQKAVRFDLYLGFGAEARALLTALPTDQPDAPLWNSMAHILDGEPDVSPAFLGMAACDTTAALWAMLSAPAPTKGEAVNRAAVLRSFSALPVHLRRHLGPALADRFIAVGDAAAAQTVRDAVVRAPGDAGPDVALMEARLDVEAGKPDQAELRLDRLIETPGPATPEALLALVDTRVAQGQPMTGAEITALEGLLHERRGSPDEARFSRALTIARAAGGDFDTAFAELAMSREAMIPVWQLLADLAPDSAVLTHAILNDGPEIALPAPIAAKLAERLAGLGFADAADRWLVQVPDPDIALSTQIALQQRDARRALRLIAGSDDAALVPLRAAALAQLGDDAALATLFAQSDDDDSRWRAVARTRDWGKMTVDAPVEWQGVAALLASAGPANAETGALEQGQGLLQTAVDTRLAIDALLAAVNGPTEP